MQVEGLEHLTGSVGQAGVAVLSGIGEVLPEELRGEAVVSGILKQPLGQRNPERCRGRGGHRTNICARFCIGFCGSYHGWGVESDVYGTEVPPTLPCPLLPPTTFR